MINNIDVRILSVVEILTSSRSLSMCSPVLTWQDDQNTKSTLLLKVDDSPLLAYNIIITELNGVKQADEEPSIFCNNCTNLFLVLGLCRTECQYQNNSTVNEKAIALTLS